MEAPGRPGAAASWGPGRKEGFGTAASRSTRTWFTLARGNLSEVFHPRIDRPCLHELRFLVAAPGAPPVDDAHEAAHQVAWLEPGVPVFRVRSEHDEYTLAKEFACHPSLDAVLISGEFEPHLPDLGLYLQAAAHVEPGTDGNDALVLDSEPPVLTLRRGAHFIAIVGSFDYASAGFVAASDLHVELHDTDGRPEATFATATGGNVAVGARLALHSGPFQVAVGFGPSRRQAEETARAALRTGAAAAREQTVREWQQLPGLPPHLERVSGDGGALAAASMAIIRCLEDKTFPGAFVASPAAPWGEDMQDGDQAYHRVWPRDLYHMATALLDCGDPQPGLRALEHLERTQLAEGGWPQNADVDGEPHWIGVELDHSALAILLAWRLAVAGALERDPWESLVRPAARHLAANGPSTPLDRWEDSGGLSPSTLAVSIAALVAAAEFAGDAGDAAASRHLLAVADHWNDRLDAWLYVAAFRHYVRLNPDPDAPADRDAQVGIEFIELVRHGLRAAGDQRVEHSLSTADALLRVDLPQGPAWKRYVGDAYGESPAGGAWYLGGGVGRPWPLLTGERAHLELALHGDVGAYVRTLEAFAGASLCLPEQVWDGDELPARGLVRGGPTDSVAPLGWAHAEYLSLLAAFAAEKRPDVVLPALARYGDRPPESPAAVWHRGYAFGRLAAGRDLVVQLDRPGAVRWTADTWATFADVELEDTGLDLFAARLPAARLPAGASIQFTARHPDGWEGENYLVTITTD